MRYANNPAHGPRMADYRHFRTLNASDAWSGSPTELAQRVRKRFPHLPQSDRDVMEIIAAVSAVLSQDSGREVKPGTIDLPDSGSIGRWSDEGGALPSG